MKFQQKPELTLVQDLKLTLKCSSKLEYEGQECISHGSQALDAEYRREKYNPE